MPACLHGTKFLLEIFVGNSMHMHDSNMHDSFQQRRALGGTLTECSGFQCFPLNLHTWFICISMNHGTLLLSTPPLTLSNITVHNLIKFEYLTLFCLPKHLPYKSRLCSIICNLLVLLSCYALVLCRGAPRALDVTKVKMNPCLMICYIAIL